jgi:SAM-dependent methyltransferase
MVDQSQLRVPDVYGRTHEMDEATLAVMAERLEIRGKHPFFVAAIGEYTDRLALAGTEAILDLGCGTGVAGRTIARRPDARGPVTATDISPRLVEAGRRLAEQEGLGGRIDFRVGDAHGLELPEGDFDMVVMHTLISHVADRASVLAEARRLLRPGGRLAVFDGDYASLTSATDAPDGGEATDRAAQSGLIAQPRVMRAMPRLLAGAGFTLDWSRAYILSEIGRRADYFGGFCAAFRVLLPKAGAMAVAEAEAFVDGLERDMAEGRFFGSCNYYAYVARRGD